MPGMFNTPLPQYGPVPGTWTPAMGPNVQGAPGWTPSEAEQRADAGRGRVWNVVTRQYETRQPIIGVVYRTEYKKLRAAKVPIVGHHPFDDFDTLLFFNQAERALAQSMLTRQMGDSHLEVNYEYWIVNSDVGALRANTELVNPKNRAVTILYSGRAFTKIKLGEVRLWRDILKQTVTSLIPAKVDGISINPNLFTTISIPVSSAPTPPSPASQQAIQQATNQGVAPSSPSSLFPVQQGPVDVPQLAPRTPTPATGSPATTAAMVGVPLLLLLLLRR